MAIEITVAGNGKFAGARSSITSYSVTEDSTPLDPGDSSGGTGIMSFGAKNDPASDGSILLMNDTITLSDGASGTTVGTVDRLTASNGSVTVSGSGRLNLLNSEVVVPAINDTLNGAVYSILALAGVTTGIVVDTTVASIPVKAQGGNKNLWVFLKELCTAHQVEIALVSNNIVVREPREREAFLGKLTDATLTVANGQLAQNVEVAYYNYQQVSNGMVYPYGGWNSDVSVYQVDANETRVISIPVDVSLASLSQPTMVTSVAQNYSGPTSVYAVAGNDGLPVSPAFWTSRGGSLTVAIGDDGQSIDVTIKSASEEGYAPYQIAISAGASNAYSSLRIIGTGLGFTRKTTKVPTGTPASKTPTDIGITIDNPWVDTQNDAQAAGLRAAAKFAAANQSITIGATFINRLTESGSYAYPTFADFDATQSGIAFDAFDAAWVGQTFSQFNTYQYSLVQNDFANQVFGNIGGARIRYGDAMYRIRSATKDANKISGATAESDTTIADFNTVWADKTFADFDTKFVGLKFEDHSLIPLAR